VKRYEKIAMRDEEITSKETFFHLFKGTEQNVKWQEKLADDVVKFEPTYIV
jgi:hypothetical protein